MILNLKNTTGILARKAASTKVTLTFVGSKWSYGNVTVTLIDWSTLSSVEVFSKDIYVPARGANFISIPLFNGGYYDDLDIRLYEVKVSSTNSNTIINLFEE